MMMNTCGTAVVPAIWCWLFMMLATSMRFLWLSLVVSGRSRHARTLQFKKQQAGRQRVRQTTAPMTMTQNAPLKVKSILPAIIEEPKKLKGHA